MAGPSSKMTATFDSGKGNQMPIKLPEVQKKAVVTDAYWVDSNLKKTTLLHFQEKAYALIKGQNLVGRKAVFKVYESDFGPMNDDFIWEYKWTIAYDETKLSFNVTPSMFVKGEEDLVHFYFTLEIDGEDEVEYANNDNDYLKVHLVRYVPGVLRAKGWKTGADLQDEWFSRAKSSDPDANEPNTDIVTMNWTLGYSETKALYDSMISQKIWVNAAGKKALISEIKRMINDKEVKVPVAVGAVSKFGVFDDKIITYKGAKIPKFDKYHYQERAYSPGTFSSLNGLTAALANFVFRMAVGGTITKKKNSYLITVTKVATYVRDSFDFIDDSVWGSQDLGYWDIKNNKVAKFAISGGYRHIYNSSYQEYQNEFNKGGDFRLFSDLKYHTTNDSFEVPAI